MMTKPCHLYMLFEVNALEKIQLVAARIVTGAYQTCILGNVI